MSYLVRASKFKPNTQEKGEDLYEFETEEEASSFADWKAEQLRKNGYEFFDVRVYQQIG